MGGLLGIGGHAKANQAVIFLASRLTRTNGANIDGSKRLSCRLWVVTTIVLFAGD